MKRLIRLISLVALVVSLLLLFLLLFMEIREYTIMNRCQASLLKCSMECIDECQNDSVTIRRLDVEQLLEANKDFIGWIYNANVDFPLVCTQDNQYYLSHNFYKERSKYGAVFLDYRTSSDDDILLIHGHNTADGSMFGSLKRYVDETSYAETNKNFYVALDTQNYEFENFTAEMFLVVDEENSLLDPSLFNLVTYKRELLKQSGNVTTESFTKTDKLVILSTCYGSAGTDKRLLIVLVK